MSSKTCSCCSKVVESHLILTCSVCQKRYANSCVGLTSSEVRTINSKKAISWSCRECEAMGSDITSLKAVIVALQTDIKQLKTSISAQSTSTVLSESIFEDVVREVQERESRKSNIIIFGMREQPDSLSRDQRSHHELENVKNVLSFISETVSTDDISTYRIGKFNPSSDRPRLLKVALGDQKSALHILKSSRKLKDCDAFKHLSISSDKTPKQMQYYRMLKLELDRRKAGGEENIGIRYVHGIQKIVNLN